MIYIAVLFTYFGKLGAKMYVFETWLSIKTDLSIK